MAFSFVGCGAGGTTPTLPAGWQPGDLLLLPTLGGGGPSAGYTLLGQSGGSIYSAGWARVYGKQAVAGEAAPSLGGGAYGVIGAYRGVALPNAVSPGAWNGWSSSNHDPPPQDFAFPVFAVPGSQIVLAVVFTEEDVTSISGLHLDASVEIPSLPANFSYFAHTLAPVSGNIAPVVEIDTNIGTGIFGELLAVAPAGGKGLTMFM